jgi:hypothetical protein
MSAKLRILGVPESFNIPVMATPSIEFLTAPGGTGAMLAALVDRTADISLALTESVIAAIEKGSPVRILTPFVTSPLTWAICVRRGQPADHDLSAAIWGVSRLGSGSHTMASVLCKKRGYPLPKFKVCGDFAGLRAALSDGTINAFLWEMFTTSPFAAAGELDIVGGVPTPWGCFCAVVDPSSVDVARAREAMNEVLASCLRFEDDGDGTAATSVVEMSGMTLSDAKKWHAGVRYAKPGSSIGEAELTIARDMVFEAGVIDTISWDSVGDYCV